jgi:hypothetical protein
MMVVVAVAGIGIVEVATRTITSMLLNHPTIGTSRRLIWAAPHLGREGTKTAAVVAVAAGHGTVTTGTVASRGTKMRGSSTSRGVAAGSRATL